MSYRLILAISLFFIFLSAAFLVHLVKMQNTIDSVQLENIPGLTKRSDYQISCDKLVLTENSMIGVWSYISSGETPVKNATLSLNEDMSAVFSGYASESFKSFGLWEYKNETLVFKPRDNFNYWRLFINNIKKNSSLNDNDLPVIEMLTDTYSLHDGYCYAKLNFYGDNFNKQISNIE